MTIVTESVKLNFRPSALLLSCFRFVRSRFLSSLNVHDRDINNRRDRPSVCLSEPYLIMQRLLVTPWRCFYGC